MSRRGRKPSGLNAAAPADKAMEPQGMPMMAGQCSPSVDPVFVEENALRDEVIRALNRLVIYQATHNSWRLPSTSKAIEALRNY